jgi:cell division protein FtsB
MLAFYQKRSWRAWLATPWFMAIVGVICLLLAFVVYDRYTIEREMAARRALAETELQALQVRYEELEEKVDYLKSERGIEAEMRRNFDVARPGEQVVIILDDEKPEAVNDQRSASPDAAPWYQFWR